MNTEMECPKCNGTGRVQDPKKVGHEMAILRMLKNLSQREIAEKLGISAMYVCDFEHGRRVWSEDKIAEYRRILNQP